MGYRPHRYPTMFPVELLKNDQVVDCFLSNITATGAGVFKIDSVRMGDMVKIKSSIGVLEGTVRWVDDDQCGIEFARQLGQRQIEQIRHSPTTFGAMRLSPHSFQEMR